MMPFPISTHDRVRPTLRRDLILALIVAAVLSVAWAVNDWPQVGRFSLPDTDDMMRLAQIRDLIAGQGFNDWTQYRLGPPGGAPMHWSRLNDLVPAAIILSLRPLLGTAAAELTAILLWPALLFAGYLLLSARLARRIGPAAGAPIALVLAAIAYPANSLFLPGRIDHHALQIVLILAAALALSRGASARSGAAGGAFAALSFGVGLETAPQVAALMFAAFGLWVVRGNTEAQRLAGFGSALCIVTGTLFGVMRPTFWSDQWCDAFTPASVAAAFAAGAVFLVLAVVTRLLTGWQRRLCIGGGIGALALGAVLVRYPACLTGPYGPMDPFVRHALIDNIVEARGLFASGDFIASGIPSIGVMLVASIVALWVWWRRPARRATLAPLMAALFMSDLVVLAQLRGAYFGSALAAPLLAQLVMAARRRTHWRMPAVLAAWAVSAGMLWLVVPQHIALASVAGSAAAQVRGATASCRTGAAWEQLDRLPAGLAMTSTGTAAYLIGGTHHQRSVGAGYHRNNAGNRAMYDFFLADAAHARAIGTAWRVDYVLICPIDFGEIDIVHRYPASVGAQLIAGEAPSWLRPIPLHDTGLRLYRVVG